MIRVKLRFYRRGTQGSQRQSMQARQHKELWRCPNTLAGWGTMSSFRGRGHWLQSMVLWVIDSGWKGRQPGLDLEDPKKYHLPPEVSGGPLKELQKRKLPYLRFWNITHAVKSMCLLEAGRSVRGPWLLLKFFLCLWVFAT